MAPILASATGVAPCAIDDPSLRELHTKLCELPTRIDTIADLRSLTELLEPYALNWLFAEQVDLFHWIRPLNTIDSILSWLLTEYGKCLILVPAKEVEKKATLDDIQQCPAALPDMAKTLLQFTATLLHNASNKSLYNTSMTDWIAAADDDLADAALSVYFHCALPVQLHKIPQPPPENLVTSNEYAMDRLVALTRGYGSAAGGLGLDWAMVTDDSQPLPDGVGNIYFRYYTDQSMQTVELSSAQMLKSTADQPKRRKALLSTAEIFFMTTNDSILDQFALLTEIRLARSAHSRKGRHAGIRRRLQSICAILYTQPEVLNSYFPAQPELIVELVELVKDFDDDMALHTLTALVSRRDGRLSNAVLAELGVGKGQYLGLLPALLRSSLSSLRGSKVPVLASTDPSIQIGLAFLDATEDEVTQPPPLEQILLLTSAVVAMPAGIAALVDCGLLPTLLTIIATSEPKFIASLAAQILETALTSYSPSISALKALNGFETIRNRLDKEMQAVDSYSKRTLIFGLLTCLTVLVNHESARFRELPLVTCLEKGGQIAALACNIISEVTNNDPNVASVVKYIHSTSLPETVFSLMLSPEACSELLMAIPNVLFSMALTEAGAEVVIKANPFPRLIECFYCREFAMPYSRCLLNEIATAVGTSLEDIMRNVEALKPVVIGALVEGVKKVADFGRELVVRELTEPAAAENDRSCFIHFIQNFGQLLEQVLQHDDHSRLFVEKGGFDVVLELYELSIPRGDLFLDFSSCLSSPSLSSLHYGTIEESLNSISKCVIYRADTKLLLKRIKAVIDPLLEKWDDRFSLISLSTEPVFERSCSSTHRELFLLAANVQWATILFTNAITAGASKSNEIDSSWDTKEKGFAKYIASNECRDTIDRLSSFYHKCLREVCLARGCGSQHLGVEIECRRVRFRLRIVCAEGAVVRDGVEIDSCASVGTYEMGDIVEASDRCVNSSGIVRYKTSHGWVSEMTRGHGREPIAEVFRLWKDDAEANKTSSAVLDEKRSELKTIAVPGLRAVATNIFAKGQDLHIAMLASLSRFTIQGIKAISRTSSFEERSLGSHIASILNTLVVVHKKALSCQELKENIQTGKSQDGGQADTIAGCCIYIGAVLHQFRSIVFDDRRERRVINFPVVVGFLASELSRQFGGETSDDLGIFDLVQFAVSKCFDDFTAVADGNLKLAQNQCVCRYTAATLPPVISFLRSIVSHTLLPSANTLSRIKITELGVLVLDSDKQRSCFIENFTENSILQTDIFLASLQCLISRVALSTWSDARLAYAPPFLLNPVAVFVGETVLSLEESASKKGLSSDVPAATHMRLSELMMRRAERRLADDSQSNAEASFMPDESIVARVMEMGFSRDHAVHAAEMTQSAQLSVVMDYALNNPPPSAAFIEQRRTEQNERSRASTAHESVGDDEIQTERLSTLTAVADGSGSNTKSGSVNKILKDEVEVWYQSLPRTTCELVCCRSLIKSCVVGQVGSSGAGGGDLEAGTMILSSFLVDLGKRRDSVLRQVVEALVKKMGCCFVVDNDGPSRLIKSEFEFQASCICHALSILLRCHPSARLFVLRSRLMEDLINAMSSTVASLLSLGDSPVWLSPAILLVGLMSQPTAAFPKSGACGDCEDTDTLQQVKMEHELQSKELSRILSSWHANSKTISNDHSSERNQIVQTDGEGQGIDGVMTDDRAAKDDRTTTENGATKGDDTQVASIPSFFPMLPRQLLRTSLDMCIQLFRAMKGVESDNLKPGLMQSVMVLLLHLLRDPSIAPGHVRNSLAESIVAAPLESKFEGNAGLSGLLFRRLIEDSDTLLSSMEMEIRKAIVKMHANSEGAPKASLKALSSSLSDLLFREPIVFTRALCLSTKIETTDGEATAFLLSPSEKSCLIERFRGAHSEIFNDYDKQDDTTIRLKRSYPQQKRRSKSHQKNKKGSSKSRKDESSLQDHPPSYKICNLIMTSVLSMYGVNSTNRMAAFLSVSDHLNILADLCLALPQCASAVSGFKIRSKDKVLRATIGDAPTHAFLGAHSPPKTFVNFLLHCILPQDLWSIRNSSEILESVQSPDKKERRKVAKSVLDLVHAAARVAISLVVRPSESRKKLVCDLSFALSGGLLTVAGLNRTFQPIPDTSNKQAQEMHAINAWVELCLAIAAPRSTGRDVEGNGALDIANIKLLLDHGMFHALLYSMKRLRIEHPMANSTCGLLLLALEILSRSAVTDGVNQLIQKEKERGLSADATGPSQMPESVAEYGAVVESLNADFAVCDSTGERMDIDVDGSAAILEGASSQEDENEMEEYDEESGSDVMDDDEDNESELDETDSSSEESDEDGWEEPDAFALANPESQRNVPAEMMSEGSEDETEYGMGEGWTHVDNDDMEVVNDEMVDPIGITGHAQGYDAEAMIGSLLRNGDISGETIAEIEGSLGIRLVHEVRGNSTNLRQNDMELRGSRIFSSSLGFQSDRQSDSLSVFQRSQSDLLVNSLFGRNGSLGDFGTMEFVYGNPALMSANRRNFDIHGFFEIEEEDEEQLSTSHFVLFPGGPSNGARSTLQVLIHPLLSEIELPPPNSLVSDLQNHHVRASRRLSSRRRRMGVWTSRTASHRRYFSFPSLVSRSPGSFAAAVDQRSSNEEDTRQNNILQSFVNAVTSTFRPIPRPQQAAGDSAMDHTNDQLTAADPTTTSDEYNPGQPRMDEPQTSSNPSGLLEDASSTLVSELRDSLVASSIPDNSQEGGVIETNVSTPEGDGSGLNDVQPQERENDTEQQVFPADHEEVEDSREVSNCNPLAETPNNDGAQETSSEDALPCPPGFDEDVFASLPREMQLDCIGQYNATQELASQLDGSSLDPAVLAELPEDMRREVIEQDRRERQRLEEESSPADPTQAQEMDSASIIASMGPELREEVLLTLDEAVLSTLPPSLIAEAQVLRDRASLRRRANDTTGDANANMGGLNASRQTIAARASSEQTAASRRRKTGKIKIDADREQIVYLAESLPPPVAASDIKALLRLLFMLSPIRPNRALHRFLENLCSQPKLRIVITTSLVSLLHEDFSTAIEAIDTYGRDYGDSDGWRTALDSAFSPLLEFPPGALLGAVPNIRHIANAPLSTQRQGLGAAASLAANSSPSDGSGDPTLQPVVAVRIVDVLGYLFKNGRFSVHALQQGLNLGSNITCFERLLELLKLPTYTRSSATLEHLLSVIELCVAPLSHLPRQDLVESNGLPTESLGKVLVDIPRVVVSPDRLNVLCSLLRLESCRDSGFTKVNGIIRRICRIEVNRKHILGELASVARTLGSDAFRDLRALRINMERAAGDQGYAHDSMDIDVADHEDKATSLAGTISSSISFSTSTSELKLLRVLQTLQSLCLDIPDDQNSRKSDGGQAITPELVHMLRQMPFDDLWGELTACLKVVQVLEGVKSVDEGNRPEEPADGEGAEDVDEGQHKRLRNSAAGLLARFLPSIEAFFIANASFTKEPVARAHTTTSLEGNIGLLVEGDRVLQFVTTNKILLNALLRSNSALLDKGLHAMVQIPRFRLQLSFDVKRHWFKTQIRRLRQQASRRYGSLRLHIRRNSVFQEAFFQLQPRNAEEMRGRLHVTFRNEEGVDAGGLSREFFNILAKEMFNPNYALFTSTEDGCTFQPNPNSMINPDHLSYFRFVGRIVGKAITDGYLLDAHFTRSLYKHMLGLKPTHPDMEAIDPDYYGNLKTILENNLVDMGLEDMTFSIEDHSFGRNQVIDLVPNGRNMKVTDQNKEEYVQKVCEHRMTSSIQSQIKSYLDGLYEIVNLELIAIFTPRELELLISGLPDIDVHDLKENTDYVGWRSTDKEIVWFWNVLFGLSRNEKAAFLQFVTGSSKVPLSGFSELQGMRGTQKFSIHRAGGTKGALMSAHTCFNSLDLPVYVSEEETREKLLLAINEGNGAFGFA